MSLMSEVMIERASLKIGTEPLHFLCWRLLEDAHSSGAWFSTRLTQAYAGHNTNIATVK